MMNNKPDSLEILLSKRGKFAKIVSEQLVRDVLKIEVNSQFDSDRTKPIDRIRKAVQASVEELELQEGLK